MEPEEKQNLEQELGDSFYELNGTNSDGIWVEKTIVEPKELQKLLQHLIKAL